MARAVALGARYAVEAAEQSVNQALARRTEAEAASSGGAAELKAVRARVRDLAADLDTVVNTAHGTEIARAEHRLRLQQLAEHALEEFGVEADALVAEYGPEVPVPVIGDDDRPAVEVRARRRRAPRRRRAAPAGPAGQGQPAGPGGVRGAHRAAHLPGHPARGPPQDPA